MTSTETAPGAEAKPLSQLLREVSFGGHGGGNDWTGDDAAPARDPHYATAFLRGGLNTAGIAAQVAQHFLMYEALESAAAAHRERDGAAFAFWMPELHRLPALRRDARHWMGAEWEAEIRGRYATPRILTYVNRITTVANDSLPHFVAHHYTRYLADLSGGQMIARMFRASYDLADDAGTEFYTFTEIDDPKAYKDRYRAVLDGAGFTPDERTVIADEVAFAYALNNGAGQDLEDRFAECRA